MKWRVVSPEAVLAEGMPAWELDRIGPPSQADAAALIVIGSVHLANTQHPTLGRRVILYNLHAFSLQNAGTMFPMY